MKTKQSIENALVGKITFPLTNLLFNRKGVLKTYRNLMKSEWYSEEALSEHQLARVQAVIAYAIKYIPYYRRKFREADIKIEDIHSLEDFRRIPPLTRQEVIENHHELVDERLFDSVRRSDAAIRSAGEPIPFAVIRRDRIVKNTSSGSTGAPTVFYEDGSTSAVNWANELRLRAWYGLAPGVREARMSKLSTEYNARSKALILRKKLWNQLILPGTNLSESDYDYCIHQIEEFKPQVIWGYPSALAGLADYLYQTGTSLNHQLKLAITWAGPLYEHEEKSINNNFNCFITNVYGAREVGHIAARCPDGSLHVNQENILLESDGQVKNEPGELLATTLWESPMPFIRYRMGDIGVISERKCSCGRSLHMIDDFIGRTGEIYHTSEGRMISPNFWCRTFMDDARSKAVKRFQVVYHHNSNITVKIEKNSNYTEQTEQELLAYLQKNLPASVNVQFKYVSKIKESVSGKYQMVTWS